MTIDYDYRDFLLEAGNFDRKYYRKTTSRVNFLSELHFKDIDKHCRFQRAQKKWRKWRKHPVFGLRMDIEEELEFLNSAELVDLYLSDAPQLEVSDDDYQTPIDPRIIKHSDKAVPMIPAPKRRKKKLKSKPLTEPLKKRKRGRPPKKKVEPFIVKPTHSLPKLSLISKLGGVINTPISHFLGKVQSPLVNLMTVLTRRYATLLGEKGVNPNSPNWDDMLSLVRGDYRLNNIRTLRKGLWKKHENLNGPSILKLNSDHFHIKNRESGDDILSYRIEQMKIPVSPEANKLNLHLKAYRFLWRHIDVPQDWVDNCWLWEGEIFENGPFELYGRHTISTREEIHLAHELLWELYNGRLRWFDFLLHTCRNRRCVNPNHMVLSPYSINTTLGLVRVEIKDS